jgi:hypothetical protein
MLCEMWWRVCSVWVEVLDAVCDVVLSTGRTKSLARPGGARPNTQCSVGCSQIGIDRCPRAAVDRNLRIY